MNSKGLFRASNIRRKGAKVFLPHSEKKHFYRTDFFETYFEVDSRNQAINPNCLEKKLDLHTTTFMVHYGRHDRQTDRQIDRRKCKRKWNLEDTMYPFGD